MIGATDRPINSTASKVIQRGIHYDESVEKEYAEKHYYFSENLPVNLIGPAQYYCKGQHKLIGKKFGHMTVIAPIWNLPRISNSDRKQGIGYICRCSCGCYERRRRYSIERSGDFRDMCYLCKIKKEVENA